MHPTITSMPPLFELSVARDRIVLERNTIGRTDSRGTEGRLPSVLREKSIGGHRSGTSGAPGPHRRARGLRYAIVATVCHSALIPAPVALDGPRVLDTDVCGHQLKRHADRQRGERREHRGCPFFSTRWRTASLMCVRPSATLTECWCACLPQRVEEIDNRICAEQRSNASSLRICHAECLISFGDPPRLLHAERWDRHGRIEAGMSWSICQTRRSLPAPGTGVHRRCATCCTQGVSRMITNWKCGGVGLRRCRAMRRLCRRGQLASPLVLLAGLRW